MSRESIPYDSFSRGPFPVGVRTTQAPDKARDRLFPVEIWYPASDHYAGQDQTAPTQDSFTVPSTEIRRRQMAVRDAASRSGTYPLILFSHGSARAARRMATYLCTHLSSYGYIVAALNHFEVVATDLVPRDADPERQRARLQAVLENRPKDLIFLLDHVLQGLALDAETSVDAGRVGAVGFSFGGWTVLAATELEHRLRAVVALAPGGNSQPKPGIVPAKLGFDWKRDVPTLYLAAENDVMTPLPGICELFERTPATRQMVVLRRSDHVHFLDDVEVEHENVRNIKWTGVLAWINEEMRPISELCSGQEANLFVRGMTVAHFDAVLKELPEAQRFLASDLEAELAAREVHALIPLREGGD